MSAADHLKNIRERAEAATAGPWELIGGGEYVTGVSILVAPDDGGVTDCDAEFIAHARADLPRLLDAVEAVMREVGYAPESSDYLEDWERGHRAALIEIGRVITTALEGKDAQHPL